MSLKYNDLQPWVDMLCDALENKGASSSGIPDLNVYPYANKYREVLRQVRNKEISMYNLKTFLNVTNEEILQVTIQKHRTTQLLNALEIYFIKEFMI